MTISHRETPKDIKLLNALLLLPSVYKTAQLGGEEKAFSGYQYKNKKKFSDLTKFISDVVQSLQDHPAHTTEQRIALLIQNKILEWCKNQDFLTIHNKLKNINSHHEIRMYAILIKKACDAGLNIMNHKKLEFIVSSYSKSWEKYPAYSKLYEALDGLVLSDKEKRKSFSKNNSTSLMLKKIQSNEVLNNKNVIEQEIIADNSHHAILARDAVDYVRSHIKFGLTQTENNQYDLQTYLEIKKTTLAMRDLLKDPDGYPKYVNFLRIDPNYDLFEFDWRVGIYKETQRGSCSEMAELALSYVAERSPDTRAEVFEIWGHVFLVLGRQPNTDENNPLAWGSNAYICDPLLNMAFKASDYQKNLLAWYESPPDKDGRCMNYTEKYDPEKYGKIRAIPTMNTLFLSQRNNPEYLQGMKDIFQKNVSSTLEIFKQYQGIFSHDKESQQPSREINKFVEKYESILLEESNKKVEASYSDLKTHFQDILKSCVVDSQALIDKLKLSGGVSVEKHKAAVAQLDEQLSELFRPGSGGNIRVTLKASP